MASTQSSSFYKQGRVEIRKLSDRTNEVGLLLLFEPPVSSNHAALTALRCIRHVN
jgi:hypothetical protein